MMFTAANLYLSSIIDKHSNRFITNLLTFVILFCHARAHFYCDANIDFPNVVNEILSSIERVFFWHRTDLID